MVYSGVAEWAWVKNLQLEKLQVSATGDLLPIIRTKLFMIVHHCTAPLPSLHYYRSSLQAELSWSFHRLSSVNVA